MLTIYMLEGQINSLVFIYVSGSGLATKRQFQTQFNG